jgi:hypothetical protein
MTLPCVQPANFFCSSHLIPNCTVLNIYYISYDIPISYLCTATLSKFVSVCLGLIRAVVPIIMRCGTPDLSFIYCSPTYFPLVQAYILKAHYALLHISYLFRAIYCYCPSMLYHLFSISARMPQLLHFSFTRACLLSIYA